MTPELFGHDPQCDMIERTIRRALRRLAWWRK